MKTLYIKRFVTLGFIILLILIGIFFTTEFVSNQKVEPQRNLVNIPEAGSKVLVFAPHNDDEVLGAGEFISKALKNKANVKVVLITNGDGFKQGIQLDYLKLMPKSRDYIRYGYSRQKESQKALYSLGLPLSNIIFLGYPDGGVDHLWNSNWDSERPYKSSSTNEARSIYNNSYTPDSAYTGVNLLSDIEKIISSYKPDYIVYPHPDDHHPDHWATNAFVKYVLTIMNYKPKAEWLYLVHRGDWPTPLIRDVDDNLVPPAKLLNQGTSWYSLPLTPGDITEKRTAIAKYKSQISILGPLLIAFERKNELLGIYPDYSFSPSSITDKNVIPLANNIAISDPSQDDLKLKALAGADIIALHTVISNGGNLHIFIKLDGKAEEFIAYQLKMLFINNKSIRKLSFQYLNNKIKPIDFTKESITKLTGISVDRKSNYVHIVIPNNITGYYNHLFLNSQTSFKGVSMDKTAWRMLDVNENVSK